MPFSRRPTAHLFEKLYGKCTPDFTHLNKILCVRVVDMHYFDLDFGPTTLVLKLNLDMVVTYLNVKNYVNWSSSSKVIICIHRQTGVKPLPTHICRR